MTKGELVRRLGPMPDDAIVEADGLEAEYADYFEYTATGEEGRKTVPGCEPDFPRVLPGPWPTNGEVTSRGCDLPRPGHGLLHCLRPMAVADSVLALPGVL